MKKWLIVFTITFILTFAGISYWRNLNSKPQAPSNVLSETDIPSPSPSIWPQSTIVSSDETPIRVSWAITNPKNIELFSNLKDQKLSEEIKVNKDCNTLVSGGFYAKENTHLGLFISNYEIVSKAIESATLNGFLTIDQNNNLEIDNNIEVTNLKIGLQTGPLLLKNGEALSLKINNDQPERRIVAGKTSDNKLIFLALYREQSDLQGALLGKLPDIINLFEKQTGIDIVDAINLDGGSHSVFISNYDLLREASVIGSYFCSK